MNASHQHQPPNDETSGETQKCSLKATMIPLHLAFCITTRCTCDPSLYKPTPGVLEIFPRPRILMYPRQMAKSYYSELLEVGEGEGKIHPDLDESFFKARFFMPSAIEKVLIHQETDIVDAHDVISRLDMSNKHSAQALQALEATDSQCITIKNILTNDECSKLRTFVTERMVDDGIDDTDGCPDFQVNISENKLEQILGTQAVERIKNLPKDLDANISSEYQRVGIFIRMYKPQTRPWMPLHIDQNSFTVNIALNDDTDYHGGKLVALFENRVQQIHRLMGDATCHRGSVVHGVTSMISGTRFSMIVFLHS